MDKLQAYDSFWNSFGIPAYEQTTVPDSTETPYITYSMIYDSFGAVLPTNVSLWYRETGWATVSRKAEEISYGITRGGKVIDYDDGAMWIKRGTPWAQRMSDPNDDSIRRVVLNIEIEFFD